ncbi:hypothetical protein V8J82_03800 [Gymnodinialimonas sp. 2305UL16-5]|uniref:hypothetical protein n=1 Tax=Gymnodinialimonas mytili TaxID=3126503 RepID=UPI0030A9570D
MTEEEYEVVMDYLRSAFPQADDAFPVSPHDRSVWEENDLKVLADFFEEKGLGSYRSGDLVVSGPGSLGSALASILPEGSAHVATGFYTAFGGTSAQLQDGTEVTIDTLTGVLYLMHASAQPSPVEMALRFGSEVGGALDDLDEHPLMASDGRALLTVAREAAGELEYMEAFGLRVPLSQGGQPQAENIYRAPLREVLEAAMPFEVVTVPPPDPNEVPVPLGEGWADSWDE